MTDRFQIGQRWMSAGEPELGLGTVRSVGGRTVTVAFRGANEIREYVADNAPLRRAAFRAGDVIRDRDGREHTVTAVAEREGLRYYDCGGIELGEAALHDALSFSGPLKRFFAGQFDHPRVFDLRLAALNHQHERRRSRVRGFVGGRIDLLPHQLSIAADVSGRLRPRVLLADEVGLGKTIEACLIVHRLILTGRASRVLVVVPETLVHQWFLELLRRFNLWFHIFSEGRCTAIEEDTPGTNPFLDNQLVLCDVGLFTDNSGRLEQAVAAGWDLLVVDEAHHLGWSPTEASAEYTVVETLGRHTPGLLLLTATPEQLGVASHFARLKLLDPDRFSDLDEFERESAEYRVVARLAEHLRTKQPLSVDEVATLARILGEDAAAVTGTLEAIANGDDQARDAWLDMLIDQHGTGRVMFRNTRATVAGFPVRLPHLYRLDLPRSDRTRFKALRGEWADDAGTPGEEDFRPHYAKDPRIEWLAALLRDVAPDKVLLICRSSRKALAIESALKLQTTIRAGVFHEEMTLVQRDRNAAWFAEPDGARLLVASEIGSEGRNFQFAHHLVLFDLPLDPSILEQRIGRLDRIGQTSAVQVHVPFVAGTHQEALARWYHEGLNAFAENVSGARELQEQFDTELRGVAEQLDAGAAAGPPALLALLDRTRVVRGAVAARLEEGRDRLLEWNSFRPQTADRVIRDLRRLDEDRTLDRFMLAAFEQFFIEVEELAPRTYRLGSAGVLRDTFPGLTSAGLTVTSDRARALAREELHFLTWDHPLVTGALDLLLGSDQGSCSFARWPDARTSALYLEAVYMVECIAPATLHLDRFLAPTPVRVMVDHRGRDAGAAIPEDEVVRQVKAADGRGLLERPEMRDTLLPRLIEHAHDLASPEVERLVTAARADMRQALQHEIQRLRDLQKVNRAIRDEEIDLLVEEQQVIDGLLGGARLRLDALRLIHRGPGG